MEDKMTSEKVQREIDLLYIVAVILKYKRSIIISTMIISIISIIYVLFATKIYSSQVKMYGAIKGSSGPVNEIMESLGLISKTTALYIPDFVKSRDVAKKVISRKYSINNKDSMSLLEYWELNNPNYSNELKWDIAITKYNGSINIKKDNETELLILTVESPNKNLPHQVATAVTEEVTNFLQDKNKDSFRRARTYAEKRIKKAQKELEVLEERLTDFMNRNEILTSPSLKMEITKLRGDYQLLDAVLSMLKKQRELILIEELKDRPILYLIQQASKHEKAVRPKRRKIVIFYTIVGFIFSCAGAILKERYISYENIKEFKSRMKTL